MLCSPVGDLLEEKEQELWPSALTNETSEALQGLWEVTTPC